MKNCIGSRIKKRRVELGMSQDELAEKMGYKSRSTIAKIEKGTNDVVQSNIVKFADILNTTIAYLMGWGEDAEEESPESGSIVGKALKNGDFLLLLSLYEKLDDAGKKDAIKHLEYLVYKNQNTIP